MAASLELRPLQEKTLDALREAFRSGHRSVLMYGPTGFGKTEMAISLLSATADKGNRAAMILDRIVLCDQTSTRLDKYGIDHGVLQSGHWRYRPDRKIQVCSAQTIEKRGGFPGLHLLIVDEAHVQREQTTEFIKANPHIKVIGLSASPFTKGLGSVYSGVVSATTTKQLVDEGWLAPLRVFIAKQIDMTGAKKVAGEWSAKESTERGVKITGDVVSEWVKMTHELFGGPRKTIVFCAGVAHGQDLAEKFGDAGYNFVSISYKDDDEFKKQAIEDFSKPDTKIHGLIATDILTKGFDVSDVMIGISARPFTKSFASHVQQMGRVMRSHPGKEFAAWLDHCIASGQRVLTHRGLVEIDKILITDKIWDGYEYVTHKGVVNRGTRPVITYAGLTATPDHLVYTADEGWCSLGYCAEKQKAIITTGIGRTALRKRHGHISGRGMAWAAGKTIHACFVRMRDLWLSLNNLSIELARWRHEGVQTLQPAEACSGMAEFKNSRNARKVQESEAQTISELRWERDRVQVRFSDQVRSMDSRELRMHGLEQEYGTGQDRQQRTLRTWEHPVGKKDCEHKQSQNIEVDTTNAQIQDGIPGSSLRRYFIAFADKCRSFVQGNSGTMGEAITETKRQVWDLLDCGPRNSFTCEGLLVHNSGNYLRFRDQWDALYSDGVSELDDGAEKPKPEPTDKEKEAATCPACGALWPGNTDTCNHCGFVRPRRNDVIEQPGQLTELGATKSDKYDSDTKRRWYQELIWYARVHGKKDGWAWYKYQDKFGVEPPWKKEAVPTSWEVEQWIRSKNIAYAKRMSKQQPSASL